MSVFTSFFELLIKQTCRRASYEFEKRPKQSKFTADPQSIYSLEFLKSLYDKPRDNIHKLLQISESSSNNARMNGLNWLSGNEISSVEKKFILDFLSNVKDMCPSNSQQWIDLQHYMHYVYRNFVNANPDPSAEVLSSLFVNDIKALVKSLRQEDECQLYLRIVALLREYCIFAQWNYSKSEGENTITKLFYYYEAMLSAAKNLSTVFPEFEVIIYKNYSVCWIDFNTCIFIRYFFETDYVQSKICECLETRLSPGDTPAMFGLLEDLKNLWVKEQKRLDKINEDAALDEDGEAYKIEELIIAEHKKILTNNFWIERSRQELDRLNLSRFDHQIFHLLGDPTFHPAGPTLDRTGQCICEECLIGKYKVALESNQGEMTDKELKNSKRMIFCRKCQGLVELECFHHHLNDHADLNVDRKPPDQTNQSSSLSRIISDKIDLVKTGKGSNLPDMVPVGQPAPNSPLVKDSLPKLASEAPVFKNTCDLHFGSSNSEIKEDEKVILEDFLKHRNLNQNEQILNANMRNFIKIKKDIFNHTNGNFTGKVFDNVFKQTQQNSIGSKKCESSYESLTDLKIKELKKNGHRCEKPYSAYKSPAKSACEHNCKLEEEPKANTCRSHGTTCEHLKESKKCDCTYCEVFGTSVQTHNHKNNELRDRLRIRLHQRREKRSKDTCKTSASTPASVGTGNIVKVKNVVNKVEERVPLPSSPTNIPPAPSVKSSDSSVTSSATDDIHGLVNYIEGNTALNKMELAQKKAAKKARQRLKKEEERMKIEEDQRRIAEELKRKEAEKKKEAARKLEEEKLRNAPQGKTDGKKSKKESDKKQSDKNGQKKSSKSQILEETIPAMVTIKRVAENGGSTPTVTITLKGSTPDQDKLLYTLVNGTDEKLPSEGTDSTDNQSAKKRRKKKKQISAPAPTVITKELKVTLALDSNKSSSVTVPNEETKKSNKSAKKSANKQDTSKKEDTLQEDFQIPMLRLPPGITITKVEGPVSNRCYQVGNVDEQKGSSINVGKSGVIVVDTEKLIQNKQSTEPAQVKTGKSGKKGRKKKNKKQLEIPASSVVASQNTSNKKMITLKNPIFQSFQNKPDLTPIDKNSDGCAPAAIFTNENGMVTIRSSRLQQSLNNGGVMNSIPLSSMPKLLPEIKKAKPNPCASNHTNLVEEKNDISPFNAQEILSGLPGIEITKVDKRTMKPEVDSNKSCQTAHVSIIPACNSGDKFNFDKDDWLYDSVFTPRDVLEDDMDADELELEAFKRFCQQSIPPPRKEKVAHLNVADIVLKKKTDVNLV